MRWLAVVAALAVVVSGPVGAATRDSMVVGMHLEPPHLDPTAGAAGAIDEVTYANLFETLTRIDRDGHIVPGLAESWEVSDDGLVYTFKLRGGVRFHNGSAFDSADVKFALDRARAPDSVNAQKPYFQPIEAVDTPDPLTVAVRLGRPDGLFLFHMAQGDAAMVAPESAAGNKQKPIGTGPFRFDRWVAGDRVVMLRNPDYWGAKPALREVTFRFISDPAAQVAALLAGDVDTFPPFGAFETLPRFEREERFAILKGTTEGEAILAMNNARKPFNDVRVRRAISHAIDRQVVIDGAMSGQGTPIGSHFAPHRAGYIDLTGLYPHDRAKARALLAEAGYADGFEATLTLPPPVYARRGGEIVAALLAEASIRVKIEPVEWAQWLERVMKGKDFDLTIIAHTEPLDIDIYGRDDYYYGYRSDAFKAVMAELDRIRDEGQRAGLYGRAQRIIAEDAVNAFLFQLPRVTVQNVDVVGMWVNAPLQAIDMTAVRWK
ncbi:MAG TPA: ABC transporter substrate-binding protein [Azospirillaceae bacterium]|nr:ABC transporter substrate-binding protein [Azospirillaceae bacterium]